MIQYHTCENCVVLKGALDKVICKPDDISCWVSLLVLPFCLLKTFCPRSNLECKSANKRQRQEESITNAIRSWGVPGGSLQLVRGTLAKSTYHMLGVDEEVHDLNTPIDHHHLIASETVVLDRIKSFPRGTSYGRDGLRAQHLLNCLSGATVAVLDNLVSSITQVVNLFLAGKCPMMLGEYIASAPLTPLAKPGGGIRPIAVGTVWRRLVSKIRDSFNLCLHAWCLDNGTIIRDTLVVGEVLELIAEDGSRCGLHLNVEKTKLLWPKEDPRSRVAGVFPHNISRPLHGVKLLAQLSFDIALHSALERIVMAFGLGFGDWQWRLATLPFAFGGLGIFSAVDVLNYAFIATRLQSAAFNPDEIAAPKLIKKMADIYFTRDTKDEKSSFSLSPRQMALWRSQREDHTSDWLHVVLIFRLGQTMNGKTYRCVLCYRLGVPVCAVSKPCSACSKVFTWDVYGDHAVSCAGVIGIKHRHNAVRDTFVDICFRSGISAGQEVDIGLSGDDDKALRPADMMADFVPGRAVIDVAQRKRGKYMVKCAAIGYGFLPFSFSSLKELETDAVTLLRRIRSWHVSWKKTEEYTKIYCLNKEITQAKYIPTPVHCFGNNLSIHTWIEAIMTSTGPGKNTLQLRLWPKDENAPSTSYFQKCAAHFSQDPKVVGCRCNMINMKTETDGKYLESDFLGEFWGEMGHLGMGDNSNTHPEGRKTPHEEDYGVLCRLGFPTLSSILSRLPIGSSYASLEPNHDMHLAYKLELPSKLYGIHSTFHVSNLKRCVVNNDVVIPLDEVQLDDKLHFVEKPIEIMDREVKRLKQSRIPIVKVRWNSRRGPEFTWEREDFFKSKYPRLFAKRRMTRQGKRRDVAS
nr:hypothetical protein [Tanacetum cinerariifolium]